jgi:PIN domain nuclease of toxin-antitoxin system
MRYLLDTQILIWYLQGNTKLKASLRTIIENPLNTILVSQFSLMEISIKLKLGKLPEFLVSIEDIVKQLSLDGFELLQVSNSHIISYQRIPLYEDHRDPFDRFLLAAAFSEQVPIISHDEKFVRYYPLITLID